MRATTEAGKKKTTSTIKQATDMVVPLPRLEPPTLLTECRYSEPQWSWSSIYVGPVSSLNVCIYPTTPDLYYSEFSIHCCNGRIQWLRETRRGRKRLRNSVSAKRRGYVRGVKSRPWLVMSSCCCCLPALMYTVIRLDRESNWGTKWSAYTVLTQPPLDILISTYGAVRGNNWSLGVGLNCWYVCSIKRHNKLRRASECWLACHVILTVKAETVFSCAPAAINLHKGTAGANCVVKTWLNDQEEAESRRETWWLVTQCR